jgi:signal transducing adaptor molecule
MFPSRTLPEPAAAEIARQAEQEAAVFAQAVNVDRLLTMLMNLDISRENIANDEEIRELYRSCMALRPRIVKLIDKYSQTRGAISSFPLFCRTKYDEQLNRCR